MLRRTLSTWTLILCGIWLVGLGLYFMILRHPLLPEDLRYMGITPPHLLLAGPGLTRWLRSVFIVMGGFMAATGVLTMFIATNANRIQTRIRTGEVLTITGLLSVIIMSVVNFSIGSDFKWLLLIPAALWVVGVALFFVEKSSTPS